MIEDFIPDDEEFACDCIASKLHEALPGTPGQRAGYIPYEAVYDTQEQARRRGYWIPGLPVKAKITKVEKDMKFGIHLINAYLYTIELEHGPFKWSVVKRNKDFAVLAARLLTHRAAERIRAPVRRAQERLDDALESVGVDIIPDHREDCPYRKRSKTKIHTLSREPDAIDSIQSSKRHTVATSSPSQGPDQEQTTETNLSRDQGLTGSRRSSSRPRGRAPLARMETTVPEDNLDSSPRKSTQSSTQNHRLPSLKFIPDSVADPEERRRTLEAWLQAVLHIPVNRNHHETAEFLEVSRFSFISEVGGKYTEGFVKKRPGGTRVFIGWKSFCVRHCLRWSKRWLILKDTSVCYMDARTEQIRFVLLFDRDFEVSAGLTETEGLPSGLTITNQQHELALKCASPLDAEKWKVAILESMNGSGRIWREPHPYGSTFPLRRTQSCQWFVDGRKYMEHAANMMELAQEEIFIADWWLSPEIYLKRPLIEGNRWRLDELLRRKAEQGVRIFVLLYKEMEMALGLNSIYTKRTLQGLHKNIKVMRHPDHYISSGTFFWAHHEKLVIVDQMIAFVGGVDLCYGRWDDCRHKLTDLGSVKYGLSHAMQSNKDFSMLSAMRTMAAESVTLSPLGLEPDENVPGEKDTNMKNSNRETNKNPERFTSECVIMMTGSTDDDPNESAVDIDKYYRSSSNSQNAFGDSAPITSYRSSYSKVDPRVRPLEGIDEVDECKAGMVIRRDSSSYRQQQESVVGDGQSNRVITSKTTSTTTFITKRRWKSASQSKASSKSSSRIRKSSGTEEDSGLNESQRPIVTASTTTTTVTRPLAVDTQSGGSQRLSIPTTPANADEQQRTGKAKRFLSAIRHSPSIPRRLRGHTDLPPTEMVAMNAKHMDMHEALNKYKEYVESGKAFEDKRRADRRSPSIQKKHSLLYRMTHPSKKKHWWKRVREETGQYDIKWMELKNEDERIKSLEMEGAAKLWLGKDYVNFIYKDFVELDMPFHDFIDRGCTPRMPWHDIHAVTYGSSARDLARHFIQRWNATKTEKSKDEKDYPFLLPKSYDTIKVPRVLQTISECADVQVLRSVSNWSTLINHTEDSIQQAYLSLIANSQHCIYIENQFFVSLIKSTEVYNEICRVLCDRIKRAYDDNQKFRVYIVLPLLPAFEGDVGAPGGSALQAVLHWTFLSLSKGPHSLIEVLKKHVPDPMKYIKVCSLRTWDILCGKLVTELVYIHSKCMIVDDKYTIIGSANINDRSQCGNRDSEVCIVVKDCEFVDSKMNGQPYKAGKYALSLRKHLMSEHLGLLPEQATRWGTRHDQTEPIDLDDPVIDSFFFDTWGAIAKNNTAIFEEVFRVVPTNLVETFEELNVWHSQLPMNEYSPQLAEEKLRGLRGVLVEFPLYFLFKANLAPGFGSKEGYVPSSVFT